MNELIRMALKIAGITYKSAPEYKSLEDFIQYLIDDERNTYDFEDLQALNYRLKRPTKEIKKELEEYGLKLKPRDVEVRTRGFNTSDLDRFYGPGSESTSGGSGFGPSFE